MSQDAVVKYHINRIRSLIPPSAAPKEYLQEALDAHINGLSDGSSMGIVQPLSTSVTRSLGSARFTVELLDRPHEIASRPEGIVDLRIIEWLLRPALRILADCIERPSGPPWDNLAFDQVRMHSEGVCRIDLLYPGYESRQVGTGFVVGNRSDGRIAILTNAHVVRGFQQAGWITYDEIVAACDFERYSVGSGGHLFPITTEYRVHPVYDLAILFLDPEAQTIRVPEARLAIGGDSPSQIEELIIAVVGHPSFDSTRDSFPRQYGFAEIYGVKRVSPGLIRMIEQRHWDGHNVEVFLHDATTLSGSSGSCILDLGSMKVVGLHFGGWPLPKRKVTIAGRDTLAELFEANGAVPLWLLRDDPLLQDCVYFA
jgi:hypothetical protein